LFAALDGNHRDVARQKQALSAAFSDQGWELPRLLDAMWQAQDFYYDQVSQIHMPRWSQGRVALLGDASYCASPAAGQGTSLALVGAYVLAGELAAAAGDYDVAFARYERRMRSFVEQNQQLASGNLKGMVLQSWPQIWFQTRMLRVLPYLPGKERIIARVTQAIHQAATAITLEAYHA
jgi:2-polyprenyl-6-methoxyphenol hydroxylase-like FAD-dependent oxidoreductase